MGIILARFRKATKYEQLEKLDSQIKTIEEYGKTTELRQRKVAGRFVLLSVFVYVVTAIIFYFYFFPATMYEGLLYVIPLITAPLVIVSVKRILTWWYNRKLKKSHKKLTTLKEQKKKMLDNVMETETYKVAKKILEKFAPDEVIIRKSPTALRNLEDSLALSKPSPVGLRYRGLTQTAGRPSLDPALYKNQTPFAALQGRNNNANMLPSTPFRPQMGDMSVSVAPTPRLSMPRTILPRERSAFDRLVDCLVGDGPSNRYALICKQCFSHNGMALSEEFEYLSFHCCYCHTFNPSKKQRPPAPKLGIQKITSPRVLNSSDTSESERNSASDSESDTPVSKTLLEKSVENNLRSTPPKTTTESVKADNLSSSCSDNDMHNSNSRPEVVETVQDVLEPVLDVGSTSPAEQMDISEVRDSIELMEISGDKDDAVTNKKD